MSIDIHYWLWLTGVAAVSIIVIDVYYIIEIFKKKKVKTVQFQLLTCHSHHELSDKYEQWLFNNKDAKIISTAQFGTWSLLITYKK